MCDPRIADRFELCDVCGQDAEPMLGARCAECETQYLLDTDDRSEAHLVADTFGVRVLSGRVVRGTPESRSSRINVPHRILSTDDLIAMGAV
jgi:hypothetical protein